MQKGPQSQGQWCWYTGTPLCLRWHRAVGSGLSRGFFLFRRGAVTGVLAPEAPDPTGGPWTPPGDGSGPAWASSPGRVAVGAHVTRQVGTAVSAVWQCHSAVTAAAREARAVPPSPQFTSRWGTAPGAGGGHSPPAPSRAADPSRGGQGDRPQPPASAPGTAGAQCPEQSPFVQVSPHPLLSLGRHPKPSRNRTQPGSAFESPQEGSAELPKADEHPPFPPRRTSPVLQCSGCRAWPGSELTIWGHAQPL